MIIAELKGKLPSKFEDWEDILTSNVFSFFKYSNRILFKEYLGVLGIKISLADAKDAEFIFWLNYEDGTEPDLVVQCGRYYILFEAKLYSKFAPRTASIDAQIDREIKMGKLAADVFGGEFIYVAITAEYFKYNSKYSKYEDQDFRFIWTNWQQVARFLESIQPNLSSRDSEFAIDLHFLLVKKRLRSYNGVLNLSSKFNLNSEKVIFYNVETSKYKGKYSGFVEMLSGFPRIETYYKFYDKTFFNLSATLTLQPTHKIFYDGH